MKVPVGKPALRHRIMPAAITRMMIVSAIIVVTACNNDDDDPQPDVPACMLTSVVSVGTNYQDGVAVQTYTRSQTYQYDDNGNLLEAAHGYIVVNSGGSVGDQQMKNIYEYDADGFVVYASYVSAITLFNGQVQTVTNTDRYTYENERLSMVASNHLSNDGSIIDTTRYTYDTEGKLLKYTHTSNSAEITIAYEGKRVIGYTTTYASGYAYEVTFEYNAQGRMVKSKAFSPFGSDERRYEYTSEGLVAREELYYSAGSYIANVYTYDAHQNAVAYPMRSRKGMLEVPNTIVPDSYKHNYLTTQLLTGDGNGGWQDGYLYKYEYTYNDKDFPVTYARTATDANGIKISSETATFEYANCN